MNIRYKTTTTKCNAIHSFFNMQLKAGRGRGFTCMTFGKCPHYIERVQNRSHFLYNSSAFLLSFLWIFWISFYPETSPLEPFSLFLWPDSILLHKRKMTMETRLFIFFWIVSFWQKNVSLHLFLFSPFHLKSSLNQKLQKFVFVIDK